MPFRRSACLELVRLEQRAGHKGIEMIHGSPVYRLRGPVVAADLPERELEGKVTEASIAGRLASGKNIAPLPADAASEGFQAVNIVVLEADGRQFGLVVDEINDTEEIVVKPLSKHLKSISVYAGATIMATVRWR